MHNSWSTVARDINEHAITEGGRNNEGTVDIINKLDSSKKYLDGIADFFKNAAKDADIWITDEEELSRAHATLAYRENIFRLLVSEIEKIS